MREQFNLEIKEPCKENFNQFEKTDKGGFCGSCEKEVVDFTGMNTKEIITYFKQNDTEKTCGRLANIQLTTYGGNTKPKRRNYVAKMGFACLSLFGASTLQAQVSKPTPVIEVKSPEKQIKQEQQIKVKGMVSDSNDPLPGANVLLQGTSIGVETDFDGKFTFPKLLKKGDVLVVSFIGCESKKIVIKDDITTSNVSLDIKLKNDTHILMGSVDVKKVYSSKKKK